MGAVADFILIILIVVIVLAFLPKIVTLLQFGISSITNQGSKFNFTFPNNVTNASQTNQKLSVGPLLNYTLNLINRDRGAYGLPNVTLSPILSGQQHADSMLQYNYFSHWDIYGMKPYMRYTLFGGRGAVQENIAYTKSGVKACLGPVCKSYGNINVTSALSNLEYNFMYNDSACCNNGHRDNILDPHHNQVSIGIAYNSTNVYLVEDFINNYITWLNGTPGFSGNETYLKGSISPDYRLSTIEVDYDPLPLNMTRQQLDQTSDYGYGTAVGGVVSSSFNYYPNLTTIVANAYYTKGSDFLVAFDMGKLIKMYGPGEYTVVVWLNNSMSSASGSFVGSTYTIFIGSNGTAYSPPVA